MNLFGEEVFINIVNPSKNINLLFLEKQSSLITKAQQANLATIGQLSATVAHELRNPMSAIYSASQLLLESPDLPEQEFDLAEIISKQIERANRIIEEILLMSKHHDATKIKIEIISYIKNIKAQFCEQELLLPEDFVEPKSNHKIYIDFDINMFRQVVWNLISNAIRHGETGTVEVEVVELEDEILIDFKNKGSELEPAVEVGLFTPFYTTHNQGTGLGLFICREMCNANQAKLDYLHQDFKHVFRIHVPK